VPTAEVHHVRRLGSRDHDVEKPVLNGTRSIVEAHVPLPAIAMWHNQVQCAVAVHGGHGDRGGRSDGHFATGFADAPAADAEAEIARRRLSAITIGQHHVGEPIVIHVAYRDVTRVPLGLAEGRDQ